MAIASAPRPSRPVMAAAALVVAAMLIGSGCSTGPTHEHRRAASPTASSTPFDRRYEVPVDSSARYFFAGLRSSVAGADGWYPEETLGDYLPNQSIRIDGKDVARHTAVVVGTVVAVLPGRGYRVGDGSQLADADRATVTADDDPTAQWKIAKVQIDVAQQWGLPKGVSSRISVGGFLVGQDFDRQAAGISTLGDVVVVLDLGPSYTWDPELFYVARGGSLLGDIDRAGTIGFPALGDESRQFVGTSTTPALLAADALRAKTVLDVSVDRNTGAPIRHR